MLVGYNNCLKIGKQRKIIEEFYHEPHEPGANLESEEINYRYARSRDIEIRGSCPKVRCGLHDKITYINP